MIPAAPVAPDWVELGRLQHLAVEDADLAVVQLVQLGLLAPIVQPTPAALDATGGADAVLVDTQSTPLARASATPGGWTLQLLRAADATAALPGRFDGPVVIVDGPVGAAPELPDGPRLWLVPTGTGRAARRLLNRAGELAGADDTVRRLPVAAGVHRWLVDPAPVSPDAVATRIGTGPVVHVGDPAAASPTDRGGSVVFFTGLSGSGKSTLAAALQAELERLTTRPLTLLDGDEVRRTLSDGLGFDTASREANIRRIGWVAALASRHGGIAIAAPIAPFASGRTAARRMAEEVGEFVLVHVATDLATCEARDRKGLYARARAGEVPEFTGISSPYEEPDDADLVIDTAVVGEADAVDLIVEALRRRGRLDVPDRTQE